MKALLVRLLNVLVVFCLAATCARAQQLTLDQPETAGISGLRPFWNRPVVLKADGLTEPSARGNSLKAPRAVWAPGLRWHNGLNYWFEAKQKGEVRQAPGAIVFDAIHRRLLVRVPDAGRQIADQIAKGFKVTKVELVLPFKGTEKMARGYKEPTSFVGNRWDVVKPRWHAVAWLLRKPWTADWQRGPTYNAYIAGAGYWKKYGAQDTDADRFAQRFGPAEVSYQKAEPLDVTAVLTDGAFGATLADRLRTLSDCGFIGLRSRVRVPPHSPLKALRPLRLRQLPSGFFLCTVRKCAYEVCIESGF